MNTWREFRFVKEGETDRVWKIIQEGESYRTSHGQLDGAMQENTDTPGSKGKEDTKAFVTPEDNCKFHVSREIRKKMEHGYIEWINGKPTAKQVSEIDFGKFLPKVFCSYKPQSSVKDEDLEALHKAGTARFTRKYDGMQHLAVHHTWGWEIYSRRMDVVTERFPNHMAQLNAFDCLKAGTILVGEMVCSRPDGTDDFKAISRFCRSDPPKARKLIEYNDVPEPAFIIFDALFYDGHDLKDMTYDQRSAFWKWDFPAFDIRKADELITSVDYYQLTPDTWADLAIEKNWEGFVVTDGKAKSGKNFYSFNGKPKRPKGCYKLKPIYENDVVIYAGFRGTGDRIDGAGSVFIKQIDPNTGKWFNCGRTGSGFSKETLAELQVLLKKHNLPMVEKLPEIKKMNIQNSDGFVCMIEYPERMVGTNKFRFPIFKRFRDDKGVDECEAQILNETEPLKLDFLLEEK